MGRERMRVARPRRAIPRGLIGAFFLSAVPCFLALNGVACLNRSASGHHTPGSGHGTPACCGRWMHEYAQYHAAVLSGAAPPRYAVSVAVEKGLADRISGALSIFYYALLTNRAFQMLSYDTVPPFDWAFDSAGHINWTTPASLYPPEVVLPMKTSSSAANLPRHFPDSVNTSQYWPLYHVDQYVPVDEFFVNQSLADGPEASVPYVLFGSNRGRTYILAADNEHHRAYFQEQGMRPECLAPCAFDFLFRPNEATQRLMAPFLPALSDASALKIGIHVRCGDTVFRNDNVRLEAYDAFFDCARQIEEARAAPGQRVVWYVISDSMSLRRQARERYGDKVVAELEVATAHVDCKENGQACEGPRMAAAMQLAAAELLTYRLADVHVFTAKSGFGRLGAWLAMRQGNLYEVEKGKRRACGIAEADDARVVASTWAGF